MHDAWIEDLWRKDSTVEIYKHDLFGRLSDI